MILVMLYGIRHVLMVFLAYFPGMGGGSDTNVIKEMLSPQLMIADLPALLILISWNFRQPQAGKGWRAIWRFGRLLLLATLTAQLVLTAATPWAQQLVEMPLSDESGLVMFYLLLHLSIMAYVLLSERLKAVFLDFP